MAEYKEDDFLMLSGIQHFAFCRRQWALIHIEQQWQENVYTVEGQLLHKRAHDSYLTEKRSDVIVSRGMPIHSRVLGVSGVCDIVEFHRADDGVQLYGHRGLFRVYPIEYKKGKPKDTDIDILQLTAQAMCLEEMFSTVITEGALYYGETKRREKIEFTDELRLQVKNSFEEMHQLYQKGYTPRVKWSKSCNACSLKDICIPKLGKSASVNTYIHNIITEDEK
ncbi:CRISPR-associated protein Cas4 [Ruminococcus sp. OA3]|uniref:CRISPR-associated protein Cas4 n=1 Tax=Ruminococcus sp. OA3 TaxID=2914164 RepID=UPI001F06477A|nr:CRISPR-associated protein Cas4 [Ruminococcus sp. OA3]MCH1981168.1 CRISPR-associated protein Cas4 [Ruminococcus sp. OA3]